MATTTTTTDTQQVTIGSNGQGEVIWKTKQGQTWQVAQVSVQNNGTATCEAFVFQNSNFVCGSVNGNQDTAANPPPVVLMPGQTLTVAWTGATVSSVSTATIFYTVYA